MRTIRLSLTAAALAFASLGATPALSQNVVIDTVQCSASCNADYAQCMGSGVNMSLVTSVGDIGPRTSDNIAAARMCRQEITSCKRACYSGG